MNKDQIKRDQMIEITQRWLNDTYTGRHGYNTIVVDGKTGWTTIKALIRALQIEIGISEPNGVFGPTTASLCPTLSINSDSTNIKIKNQIFILQGALYCKGYNPGGFIGVFGPNTQKAIKRFQQDAGLLNKDGIVNALIFKALLNMDAFVNVGDPKIRIAQQGLNREYYKYIGLIPCDGRYGRETNKALIYGLQVEEGITEPNGVFGPTTTALCPTIKYGDNNNFVLLIKYALYCNKYDCGSFTSQYDINTQSTVLEFQKFVRLGADGIVSMQTWASLLISTGDKNRKGTSSDCSTTLTYEKALTLKKNGYDVVGRYLGGNFTLTASEMLDIFRAGLKIFLIFEIHGYRLEHFNRENGYDDAKIAFSYASTLGIPNETIIYFGVDFDALDHDVTNAIIPYFRGIKKFVEESRYRYQIGIYAPRNVCTRVSDLNLSCSSFVCDMSTGFSGNLGYPLPKDWAYDQISTVSLGQGASFIEIDNNISTEVNKGIQNSDIKFSYFTAEVEFKSGAEFFEKPADYTELVFTTTENLTLFVFGKDNGFYRVVINDTKDMVYVHEKYLLNLKNDNGELSDNKVIEEFINVLEKSDASILPTPSELGPLVYTMVAGEEKYRTYGKENNLNLIGNKNGILLQSQFSGLKYNTAFSMRSILVTPEVKSFSSFRGFVEGPFGTELKKMTKDIGSKFGASLTLFEDVMNYMKSIDFNFKKINFLDLATIIIVSLGNILIITSIVTILTVLINGILGCIFVGGATGIASIVIGVITGLIANSIGILINRSGAPMRESLVDVISGTLEHPFRMAFN